MSEGFSPTERLMHAVSSRFDADSGRFQRVGQIATGIVEPFRSSTIRGKRLAMQFHLGPGDESVTMAGEVTELDHPDQDGGRSFAITTNEGEQQR